MEYCHSIKNIREPNLRCPRQKKHGDYCGIHSRSKNISRFVDQRSQFDRSSCQNDVDFCCLEPISNIPDKFFFSFKSNNKIYGCDIRSFHQYVESSLKDSLVCPYDRQPLSSDTYDDYLRKCDLLKGSLEFEKTEFTPEQLLRFRILEVFQIMYNNFDFAVDHRWFLNLSRDALVAYYDRLQELWNFRLNLSVAQKRLIVPDDPNIFSRKEFYVLKNKSRSHLQATLIEKMNSMITKGATRNDCKNGALYLLMGLVEICPQIAESLPYVGFSVGL